jgi:Asp-tRNA(Asn)/Glu-tRNA(Gln) amidotransferase C subunit
MRLTKEELNEIEKLSSLLFTPEEIAAVIEQDEEDFLEEIEDKKSEIRKRYMKGYLLTKAEIRQSEINMAKRDSSPAQTLIDKQIEKIELKINKYA